LPDGDIKDNVCNEGKVKIIRLLLVEDDQMIGEEIKEGLNHRGFTLDWVKTRSSGEEALKIDNFDLLVLDLGLPDGSGLDLLRSLRNQDKGIPVIILTAWDAVSDRISGLDAGSDDYMVKPFELEELAARIRALLRRSAGRISPLMEYGKISVDLSAMEVTLNGQKVHLSRNEYSLLITFLENPGKIFSRMELEKILYGWEQEVESNTIQVFIHNLRKKLGKSIIRNIHGLGYVLEKTK
jgi:two-component system response regulator QseB